MINSPHDKYFKQLFSQKSEMKEFLANGLPQVAKLLDLNTLQLETTSYIDKKLNVGFSDLVYNCQYSHNIEIKICLLFEHKSYIVNNPYLQLLGYMLNIWEQNIKQKQKLMPIIPILFYNGNDEWNYQIFESYFGEMDSDLKQYMPIFKYEQINTTNWSDEQIQKMFSLVSLKIGVLVMKHIFDDPNYLINELTNLLNGLSQLIETESGKAFFETTVIYFLNATKLNPEQLKEKVSEISQNAVEIVETGAMQIINKAMEKVAIDMIKDGADNQIISKYTKLNNEQIEIIRFTIQELQK